MSAKSSVFVNVNLSHTPNVYLSCLVMLMIYRANGFRAWRLADFVFDKATQNAPNSRRNEHAVNQLNIPLCQQLRILIRSPL
jgi:hypothetical protein